MPKPAVTLIEILLVIILLGILAALGMINFAGVKSRTLNNEAIANLKLMAAAERIYRMEYGTYFLASGSSTEHIENINRFLKLSLPTSPSRNWEYNIRDATANTFNVTASTEPGVPCTYYITQKPEDEEPKSCK